MASGLKKGIESEEEEESESSDDSKVERIIVERYGKKVSSSQGKSSKTDDSDFSKERKKGGIRLKNMTCKKRSDHSEDRDEGRRKWKKIGDSADKDDDDRHQ